MGSSGWSYVHDRKCLRQQKREDPVKGRVVRKTSKKATAADS